MSGIGLAELVLFAAFIFPLPPLVTALLAKRKGRRFWVWMGIGFLICVSSNVVSGLLKTKISPGSFPAFQLIVGAVAGPLVTLFLNPALPKQRED